MGKATNIAVAAGIAFLIVAPAFSQAAKQNPGTASEPRGAEKVTPLGSRVPRLEKAQSLAEKQAIGVMHDFAQCIARTNTVKAKSLLAALPYSAEEARLVGEIIGRESSCLAASKMRLRRTLLRGAIAEALYDLKLPDSRRQLSPTSPKETFESLTARLVAADADGIDIEDKALLVGRWLAYCSVYEAPAVVDSFLATKPSSVQEASALRGFVGIFSRCLLQGQTLQVDRVTMRALLAEAIYTRRVLEAANA